MNPNNGAVQSCIAAGIQAEGEGKHEQARALFVQAWESADDEYEACVAAHYVARHQSTPEETLRWNQESLRMAEAVGDDRVRDFFPSLLLNLGHSYEVLGNFDEARRYYDLAAQRAEALPVDGYGKLVRNGIANGRQRVAHNNG
jgi:tetratricopeptide (TPR) repeat protein